MTNAHIAGTQHRELDLKQALESMLTIRAFEYRLLDLFRSGQLVGTTHTCIGQEANAVGVAAALGETDVIVSNHRGHGHFLAHVGDYDALMGEVMGRATGVCGGWGGSQHLCRPGRFYSNGIQGGIAPLGVGIALAERMSGSGRAVVVFLGDGTFGEGALYEAMNLVSLWSAPVLFAVEDNGIAQTTDTQATTAGTHAARAAAFDIPCVELTYPTASEVHEAAASLLGRVRRDGPAMLRMVSARLEAHSKGDDTRDEADLARLRSMDPLARMQSGLDPSSVAELEQRARLRVEEAVERALTADEPQLARRQPEVRVVRGTDAGEPVRAHEARSAGLVEQLSGRSLREQINQALHAAMETDDRVLVIGEDLTDPYGGAFKVTAGLSSRFPERVLAAPISEAAIVGVAGGLALHGYRPVVELMFGDFAALAMDQLVNHLAKYRGMYDGQVRVPVVVRLPMGGYRGYGPTHSQTLDKHLLGVPGLRVLAPSFVHPAGAMLLDALGSDGPTVFIENKTAYNQVVESGYAGMVDDFFVHFDDHEPAPLLSLSLTEFLDDHATVVTYGGMVAHAMEAARALFLEQEIACRIVAPAQLFPVPGDSILRSLADGGPVLTVEEACAAFGFGAEVGSLLAEHGHLADRRFQRLGAREEVIAASRSLEGQILPSSQDIAAAVERLLEASA